MTKINSNTVGTLEDGVYRYKPMQNTISTQLCTLPLYSHHITAGFPSPADDYIENYLDLNQKLIQHPAATFFLKASGDSMIDAGIHSGDMLIVDRSITPTHGKIVIAAINGQLTVKRLYKFGGVVQLVAANPKFEPILIGEDEELVIWGVVIHSIHSLS